MAIPLTEPWQKQLLAKCLWLQLETTLGGSYSLDVSCWCYIIRNPNKTNRWIRHFRVWKLDTRRRVESNKDNRLEVVSLTSRRQLLCVDNFSSIFLPGWFLHTSPDDGKGAPVFKWNKVRRCIKKYQSYTLEGSPSTSLEYLTRI